MYILLYYIIISIYNILYELYDIVSVVEHAHFYGWVLNVYMLLFRITLNQILLKRILIYVHIIEHDVGASRECSGNMIVKHH